MSDACHMTSMPHALASGLARSSLTLWGLSYILLCGGNSIDLRYNREALAGGGSGLFLNYYYHTHTRIVA